MIGPHAQIHFNADSTVSILPEFFKKKFGLPLHGDDGLCLVSQVVFTVSALTGIKASVLAKHVFKYIDGAGGINGYTLAEIMRTFDRIPVLTPEGPRHLTLAVLEYPNMPAVCDAVLRGYPLITIIPRLAADVIENEARSYNDGAVIASVIREAPKTDFLFHSYLMVGITIDDGKEFVVLRDSRDKYSYQGFLKVRTHILHDAWKNIRILSINVLKDES